VGAVLAQRTVPIPPHCLQPELLLSLADVGADLMLDVLRHLDERTANKWRQSEEGVTYGQWRQQL